MTPHLENILENILESIARTIIIFPTQYLAHRNHPFNAVMCPHVGGSPCSAQAQLPSVRQITHQVRDETLES